MPDTKNAKFQKGDLVWFLGMKARVIEEPYWESVFHEWRYNYKLTARNRPSWEYPKGWSDWCGATCLTERRT